MKWQTAKHCCALEIDEEGNIFSCDTLAMGSTIKLLRRIPTNGTASPRRFPMTLVPTPPAGIVFPHGASGFAHSSSNLAHAGSLLALIRCFSSDGSFHDYSGHAFALRHVATTRCSASLTIESSEVGTEGGDHAPLIPRQFSCPQAC